MTIPYNLVKNWKYIHVTFGTPTDTGMQTTCNIGTNKILTSSFSSDISVGIYFTGTGYAGQVLCSIALTNS